MARKGAKPGGKEPSRKKNLIVVRGYEAWGEWVEGLAKHLGTPVVGTVDRALRELAKREGYPPPPERY
jgi:hypothetical protein